MAEIEIEKKKPIWPWIVGLLILAALVYFLFFANNEDDDINEVETTTTEQVVDDNDSMDDTANYSEESDVDTYTTYINDPQMGLDHEYTHGALAKLIAATRATADAVNVDIKADLSEANAKAQEIMKDPMSLKHADKIKDAGQSITRALHTIQTEKFPGLEQQYNEVETAVSKIDDVTPTLDQKDTVKDFFSKAGNLLTSINNQ